MSEVVRWTREGQVGIVSIDNPPVNALSQAVRQGLRDCIREARDDEQTAAILIHCLGRTFIAGADIKEFGKPPQEPHLPQLLDDIEASAKPVVAMLHGTALGGGFETALACHYRCALPTARVGLPEVHLGLLPGAGGTQRLPRLVGAEPALDMMISGKPVGAARAAAVGIIDEIIDGQDPLEAGLAYANRLIERGAEVRRVSELRPETEGVTPGFFEDFRQRIARRTRGLLSPECIVRCVEAAVNQPFAEGQALERSLFIECLGSRQSTALRHLFFAEREVARVPDVGKDTPRRDIRSVAVLGSGTMGVGIAFACASSGLDVRILDADADALSRGLAKARDLLANQVKKGRLSEAGAREQAERLRAVADYDEIADADLVIEAVFENMAVKQEVFGRLDAVCRPGAILATNTSTLDIDRIASVTGRPEDVIGLHFFSPAHIMRLLEIVRGARTATEVIATSMALARSLGKIGVLVGNCFGFVGNRMLHGYGRESQMLLLEGASPQQIDQALYDWGMAMGPNAMGDLAGLDVGYKVRRERADLPDDPCFYRVSDMLVEMGRYGQKTGRGAYLYDTGSREPIPDPEVEQMIRDEAERLGVEQRVISDTEIVERCIYALINEGARILEEGIALRPLDIDVIWANGYGFPRFRGGPMCYADEVGPDQVYATICRFRDEHGPRYWEPAALLERLAKSGESFASLGGKKA